MKGKQKLQKLRRCSNCSSENVRVVPVGVSYIKPPNGQSGVVKGVKEIPEAIKEASRILKACEDCDTIVDISQTDAQLLLNSVM